MTTYEKEQKKIAWLADRYQALPPEKIRWRTDPGADFLIALQSLPRTITNVRIAAAFGVGASAVSTMRRKRLGEQTYRWPRASQIRRLQKAMDAVHARRSQFRQVRPDTPQFAEARAALHDVLAAGFDIAVLPYALNGVTAADLRRFNAEVQSNPD